MAQACVMSHTELCETLSAKSSHEVGGTHLGSVETRVLLGRANRVTSFLPVCLFLRLLQLKHHSVTSSGCQPGPQPSPVPCMLTPCDGLLMSGIPLLPAPLLQAGMSPVASAAQLLDTHLHISAGPVALPTGPLPQCLTRLAPSCDPAGLPQGDCEMEDLTSGQRGTFVLVQ